MNTAEQFHVDRVLPSYWRVTFDNGPVNLLDPDTVEQLGALIGRIEDDPDLTVVVFRSDKPGYFMATGTSWPTTPGWRGCGQGRPACTPTWTTSSG
jgi:enoyl-CoA hydratase/carnithine racemase